VNLIILLSAARGYATRPDIPDRGSLAAINDVDAQRELGDKLVDLLVDDLFDRPRQPENLSFHFPDKYVTAEIPLRQFLSEIRMSASGRSATFG
jgi:hypothetical protein